MKLPKEIYVKVEKEEQTSGAKYYLLADQNLIALAGLRETHEVGVYRLERTFKVSGVTEIVEKK